MDPPSWHELLNQLEVSEEVRARLAEQHESDPLALQHLEPADLAAGEGSVMVKDETICIRCGLCAERCPAHTITMEAFEALEHDPEETNEEVVQK